MGDGEKLRRDAHIEKCLDVTSNGTGLTALGRWYGIDSTGERK